MTRPTTRLPHTPGEPHTQRLLAIAPIGGGPVTAVGTSASGSDAPRPHGHAGRLAPGRAAPRPRSARVAAACLSVIAVASGCAFFDSREVGRVCTPEAARTAGASDARSGRPLNEGYASICGVSERTLNRMYADAYRAVPAEERVERGILDSILP